MLFHSPSISLSWRGDFIFRHRFNEYINTAKKNIYTNILNILNISYKSRRKFCLKCENCVRNWERKNINTKIFFVFYRKQNEQYNTLICGTYKRGGKCRDSLENIIARVSYHEPLLILPFKTRIIWKRTWLLTSSPFSFHFCRKMSLITFACWVVKFVFQDSRKIFIFIAIKSLHSLSVSLRLSQSPFLSR